jgi:hypothetical protein
MKALVERCICVKFCLKLAKNFTETETVVAVGVKINAMAKKTTSESIKCEGVAGFILWEVHCSS